jgi:transcriptional regulator with XRE-family HTH domain
MPAAPAFQAALGLAVKARRTELEITQEQLANNTGLHQRWISNIETGKRNPSYASLRRLAAGLGLSASELLARAEQIEAPRSKPRLPLGADAAAGVGSSHALTDHKPQPYGGRLHKPKRPRHG